ncbi:MAG: hypothetical protein J1E57_05475 [Prevotella sp.]|nr:hypothetical protein [Prevotella sp.]
MKKISTLALFIFMSAVATWAQTDDTFYFVDKNGNIVPDGTELTITEVEEDIFGGVMMPTGLYVKSNKSGTLYGSMSYNVVEMSNGAFQVCFPENCTQTENTGEYETPAGQVKTEDIQAEWLPEAYGTAKVTLQPKTYTYNSVTKKWTFVGDGPKITINFIYTDPAGITNAGAESRKETGRYALDGRKLAQPENGINIIKTDDGRTHKVLIK